MKKKSLAAFVLALTMVFSTAAVYASEVTSASFVEDGTRMIAAGSVSMTRLSALRAKVQLTASSSMENLDYIKATVTVERYGSNGWTQYYAPYDVYGDAETGGMLVNEYVDVQVSGTYRVKAVFSDKVNGLVSTTKAYYSQSVSL